jgi:phosphoribosylglycinamide formyltransferase-1
MKLVILSSNRGSNFEAIAKAVKNKIIPNTEIAALLTVKNDTPVADKARALNIPVMVLPKGASKEANDKNLIEMIRPLKPDYICLAGYFRLLGEAFLNEFPLQVINIHPSLLPAFPGLNAQKQALDYGVKWTGCTVHVVTLEMDAGPIIEQRICPVEKGDTEETLSQRILALEHECYVSVLKNLAEKKKPFIPKNNKEC